MAARFSQRYTLNSPKSMSISLKHKNKLTRLAVTALLALLFAGSGLMTAATALEVRVAAPAVYLAAAASVALCAVGALSARGAVAAAALFVALIGGAAVSHVSGIAAIRVLFASWGGAEADAAQVALGGRTLILALAFLFGAAFFALLNRREFVSVALVLLLGMLVAAHALSGTASVGASVPGLVAAATAFALTGGVQRDGAALRVLIPAVLAVALALAFAPRERATWPPLERAAERVRSVFEQYFNFTRERVAFSIGEQGYDHAGEIDGDVVPMLGGPAEPHTLPVMRVQTAAEALLRGTIRTEYTGYSWVDTAAKNRYLYYDLTHRSSFNRAFNRDMDSPAGAFQAADIAVELLTEGTSTLFVPGRLDGFSMDLSTAVYYNTAGEMFLSRPVQPGDRYGVKAYLPVFGDALREAVLRGESANDDRYADILATHSGLPAGVDEGVYALTMQVTQNAATAYDRAVAIADYLRANMRYTLKPDYPPVGRDFVSYFLLDSREGYCSYYATAMAVMGRIAGLPTRYVEGYLARPGADGAAVLTGADAHAWAEVYFKGVGWIPFDATGGTTGRGQGSDADDPDGNRDTAEDGADTAPGGDDDGDLLNPPTPTPTVPPQDGAAQDAPTPTPQPQDEPMDEPQESPQDESEPQTPPRQDRHWPWWALLILLLLALIALAALWARARLKKADPEILCRQAKSAREAAMIAYRANLTALSHMGQSPVNGEAPEAFAARVAKQFDCPDYAAFAQAVAAASYGRKPLEKADVSRGLHAYAAFCGAMGWRERLRFAATRVFRGLGDFEAIP